MNIIIKADGGSNIGMGHIMRTMVLAKELSKIHKVSYICKQDKEFEAGRMKIREAGYSIYDDLTIGGDILITDSYGVDRCYFAETRRYYKNLIYIDDLNLFYHDVDLLINQNINASDLDYKEPNLLLGPEYALLREEFQGCKEKVIKEKAADILITMGGSDPHNLTSQLFEKLSCLEYRFHVVVGSAFKNKESLLKLKSDNVQLYENANMKALMEHCDIAISACGSTLYELSACGTPAFGIVLADNQKKVANKFNELGLVRSLGELDTIDRSSLANEVTLLMENFEKRKKVSREMQRLVDGNGAQRIADYLSRNF